jgi:hypothetical protein
MATSGYRAPMANRVAVAAAVIMGIVTLGIIVIWWSDRGEDLESGDDRLDFTDTAPTLSGPEPAGGALDRVVCDNPLYWGRNEAADPDSTVTAPATGAYTEARIAADAAILVEQPRLTEYAEVSELSVDGLTQVDYVVSGNTVAVITVVPRSVGWDFEEGLLCEAHAAIIPPELDAVYRRLDHIEGVTLRNTPCVNERGIAVYGIDAWPAVAQGYPIDRGVLAQLEAFVAECGP